ncbi:MAG: hypothetical protein ACRYF3_05945 [Janthinobacterium lividum]
MDMVKRFPVRRRSLVAAALLAAATIGASAGPAAANDPAFFYVDAYNPGNPDLTGFPYSVDDTTRPGCIGKIAASFNDKASAVKNYSGKTLVLFSDGGCTGRQISVQPHQWIANLTDYGFNDVMSSIAIGA